MNWSNVWRHRLTTQITDNTKQRLRYEIYTNFLPIFSFQFDFSLNSSLKQPGSCVVLAIQPCLPEITPDSGVKVLCSVLPPPILTVILAR